MKKLYSILVISLAISLCLPAQTTLSDELKSKYHMLSLDELDKDINILKSIYTNPPASTNINNIAEFEPNQGVIIAHLSNSSFNSEGFKVPIKLIKEIAKDIKAYIICESENQKNSINAKLLNHDVNTDNVEYILGHTDSEWVRDYTPWYIEYGDNHTTAGVNFSYNRPRPNDNNSHKLIGNYFDLDIYTMDLVQTGGNYMTDGLGVSVSCDVVKKENKNKTEDEIKQIMKEYLGIENYHTTPDPLGEYIEHVDCWGKFLDVDKILIGKVPQGHSRYGEFESMANYWENQTSSYGNKYKVYRVNWQVNGNAYTNSLIINNKVLVPINTGYKFKEYNDSALIAYQRAMPGYEIVGIEYDSWHTTDALHCRTHEIPDLNMLRIVHTPHHGFINNQSTISFSAEVYSLNNSYQINSVQLVYKINNNEYSEINMTSTDGKTYTASLSNLNDEDNISYYIKATDSKPKTEKHPYIGEANPHTFSIKTPSSIDNEFTFDNNSKNAHIQAFPNPATSELYFISNNIPTNKYNIQIINQNGQIVQDFTYNIEVNEWGNIILNISKLKPGIYQIRAISDTDAFTTRFIKQ